MAVFTSTEVVSITHGIGHSIVEPITFSDVSTDTRTITEGALFVALIGDTFDGHDFIAVARERGAAGAIVATGKAVAGFPCIEVENTLLAYQQLANYHRNRFDIPVVAVTGSSGKTTTKEMIAAVLAQKFNVLKTEKNFNNEIGLPKTLLQLTDDHEVCVLEMGMRGFGQIEELCRIAEPTIGAITNVGTSHIELLGSREGIAKAKAELVEALPPQGIAILNEDDPYVKDMGTLTSAKTVTYGIENSATVMALQIKYKSDGIKFTCKCYDDMMSMFLPMIGVHNIYDALIAVAVGRVLSVPAAKITKALGDFHGMAMRQEIVSLQDMVVLNDAYNANPSSMEESIKALGQLDGKRKIAMLGDMLELGAYAEEGHRHIGAVLAKEKYDMLFTFGEQAEWICDEARNQGMREVFPCHSHLEIVNAYEERRQAGDLILVKGSRGLRMERVVEELVERHSRS